MEVLGGESLSGDDSKPRFFWMFSATKVINVISTMKTKNFVHVRDSRSGALTHHCRRRKPERWSNIKVKEAVMTVAEKMVIARVDAELLIGMAEVHIT